MKTTQVSMMALLIDLHWSEVTIVGIYTRFLMVWKYIWYRNTTWQILDWEKKNFLPQKSCKCNKRFLVRCSVVFVYIKYNKTIENTSIYLMFFSTTFRYLNKKQWYFSSFTVIKKILIVEMIRLFKKYNVDNNIMTT